METAFDNASAATTTGAAVHAEETSADSELLGRILFAAGIVMAAVGMALDCVTLHVLRSVKFGGRAAAMRQSLVSLCVADLVLAAATFAVCAIDYGERSLVEAMAAAASGEERGLLMSSRRRLFCTEQWAKDFWSVGVYANLLTLLIMAGEQAAAVRWPFDSERLPSGRRVAFTFGLAWAISIAVGIAQPSLLVAINAQHPDVGNYEVKGVSKVCYQRILYLATRAVDNYTYPFNQRRLQLYESGLGVAITGLTFVGLIVAYGYLFAVVRGMVLADRALVPSSSPRSAAAWRGSRRVVAATLSVTAAFLVCYWPMFTYNAMRAFVSTPEVRWAYPALFAISSLTSVADPLVYAWRLKEIRSGYIGLFKKFCGCGRGATDRRVETARAKAAAAAKNPHPPSAHDELAPYPSGSVAHLLQPLSPPATVSHSSSTEMVTNTSYVIL